MLLNKEDENGSGKKDDRSFIMMLLFGIASAELGDYGVVVGTVNYDTITDISTTKSPHLEPQQTEGKYPHYMFYCKHSGRAVPMRDRHLLTDE